MCAFHGNRHLAHLLHGATVLEGANLVLLLQVDVPDSLVYSAPDAARQLLEESDSR